jgi:hypothetical protein
VDAAEMAGAVFRFLAREPTDENKRVARYLWPKMCRQLQLARDWKFTPVAMQCDDALVTLGLATIEEKMVARREVSYATFDGTLEKNL